jgi:Na+-driven multidrug efflux pump
MDGVQCFFGGIMRGTGTPRAGTILNFIGYYVVAIPCYLLYVFKIIWRLYIVMVSPRQLQYTLDVF